MDLTGVWIFNEDFGFGKDQGKACFEQTGGKLTGFISFQEVIEDEKPFSVTEIIEGVVTGNEVCFWGISYSLFEVDEPFDYKLDRWEGIINKDGQIVGSSIDEDEVCGVFVMERKKDCYDCE